MTSPSSRRSPGERLSTGCPLPADPFDLLPADAVVAVAMSGGVDSSVAAGLCVERGLSTLGITLAMWRRTAAIERDRGCCSLDAVEDARRVAARLGIPHYVWNLEAEFEELIVSGFEAEYAAGRTPNPCVQCNQRVKFGILLQRARAIGATHVATGHYARLGRRRGRWTLHRGADTRKDQSYSLHRLDQDQLGAALFPLGHTPSKAAVRAEATRLGLATASKPDSQELCFVEEGLGAELERRLQGRYAPGAMVDSRGAHLGEHRGLPFYTVGQRRGLGRSPRRPDAAALYVLELDARRNTVVVGARDELRRSRVVVGDFSWVAGGAPARRLACEAQFRAHGGPSPVVARSGPDESVVLTCASPVSGISPGQPVVLFSGDEVLGGGTVSRAA